MSLWRKNTRLPCNAASLPGTPVRVSASKKCEICPMCTQPIEDTTELEDGQEALLCEGKCDCWYHRWCAGVSKERFAALSDSEEPFLCPSCASERQQCTVHELQDMVRCLANEVRELKATVAALQCSSSSPGVDPCVEMRETPEWSVVVSKGNGHGRRRKRKAKGENEAHRKGTLSYTAPLAHGTSTGAELKGPECSGPTKASGSSNARSHKKSRAPVSNARKIWGTLRSTACSAIAGAVKRLVSASLCEKLTIKRKFKSAQDGSIKKWWFVIRGKESDVELLEEEWHKISIQTGWKLEPVFHFENPVACEVPINVDASPSPTTGTVSQQTLGESVVVPGSPPTSNDSQSHSQTTNPTPSVSPLASMPPQ